MQKVCVIGLVFGPRGASVVVRRTSIIIQKMGSWMVTENDVSLLIIEGARAYEVE